MGQAFDSDGQLVGEAFGRTKREVFDKLAAEIRIRTLKDGPDMNKASVEMPRYKCHKTVHALKIQAVVSNSVLAHLSGNESDGSALIVPADEGYAEFRVDHDFVRKHNPQPGGYFVVYDDGYKSYSPAKAFEDGYTRLP